MAISGLRRRVLALGGNGMMNVDCSATGSSSYGASDQDLHDFQEWLDCVGRSRDDAMRRNGRAPINGGCEHLRAGLPDRTYEMPQCHQSAKCSATAIRREAPAP